MKFLKSLSSIMAISTIAACSNAKAAVGDTVYIDFVGTIDGVKFDGGSAKKVPLKLGSGQFVPGFEDQLVGAKEGQTVKVTITFPKEYQSKNLAGKTADFETKVTLIVKKKG